jgi:5-formyltetrahydrofolate cyclo-ligase
MHSEGSPPPPTGPALRSAKVTMRSRCLAQRDALPADVRAAASAAITAAIARLDSWRDARAVLLTLPFGSEWDTRPLLALALAAGKLVVLPRVNPQTRMLDLYAIGDPAGDVLPGFRGIPEPRLSCPAVATADIRWVLVPGVAFDAGGARLGYGGGFYDRLLPLLAPGTPRIAGAFELQVIDRVPTAGHDVLVDRIVTEDRSLACPAPPVRDGG